MFYIVKVPIIIALMDNLTKEELIEKENNLKIFGLRIRDLRKKSGLTQSELAERIGLSTNFIGMVERGERNTSVDKIFKLAKTFDIKLAQFFETL